MDRNKNGGGVIVFVRNNIPCKPLHKHNFTKNIEGMFLEVNLRKKKILLFAVYHSTHEVYGCSDIEFLEQLNLAMDIYSNYDRVLCAGDFNIEAESTNLSEFLDARDFKNLVNEPTCYKNPENPSCIDLFLTNSPRSFQNTTTVCTGLSDFHKMIVTIMKISVPKNKPIIHQYRDSRNFNLDVFKENLEAQLNLQESLNYTNFQSTFLELLDLFAPLRKKLCMPMINPTYRKH